MFNVETLDDKIKGRIKSGTSVERLRTAAGNFKKAKITPTPVFYIGYPWDSNETLSQLRTFLKQVPIPSFILKQVRPWKGTPIYKEYQDLGLLSSELGIDDYVHSDYPITDTLYLSKQEVENWKHQIQSAAILNFRYMWNFLRQRGLPSPKQVSDFLRLASGKKQGIRR